MTVTIRENEIQDKVVVEALKEIAFNLDRLNEEFEGRFLVEGNDPRAVVRAVTFTLEPGATPGTNINVSENAASSTHYNKPSMTNGTNIAKSGSSGSYSLDVTGGTVTINIGEDIIGILSASFAIHDLNSSSTTEMYTVTVIFASNNMQIKLRKRGSAANVDLTTILDAGDRCDIKICFLTSS